MTNIRNTNLRFNLNKEKHRRAWEHLQRMDKRIFKSHSNAAIDALNDYFDRYNKAQDDPYLETREREEQFVERIVTAVEASLDQTLPAYWSEHASQLTSTTENKHQSNPETASTPNVDWDFLGG
ncbi:MAG: adenylate cyclase [Clostridia bacterium]|nr:adenylate cyclase [Clostridia bacterium]